MSLKSVLRFLLPAVGADLGPNPLLSLLCLEWADTELGLGLELQMLWKAELTAPNIVYLFYDCAEPPSDELLDRTGFESLVTSIIRKVEGQQMSGRDRLKEIFQQVVDSHHSRNWASEHRGTISQVLTSGPGEKFLERHRRSAEPPGIRNSAGAKEPQINEVITFLSLNSHCRAA